MEEKALFMQGRKAGTERKVFVHPFVVAASRLKRFKSKLMMKRRQIIALRSWKSVIKIPAKYSSLLLIAVVLAFLFSKKSASEKARQESKHRSVRCAKFTESAPWLLEMQNDNPCHPWIGITSLRRMMELRARAKGRWAKAVSLVFYSKGLEELLQNAIFSMVEFGGVDNYIVGTWTEEDLVACMALNLPCTDVSSFLQRPLLQGNATALAEIGTKIAKKRDQATIIWARQAVVLYMLQLGYAVHLSDVDVAYAPKNVWDTYLTYIEKAQADASFHWNFLGWDGPLNAGNYVVLPTKRAVKLWILWNRSFWLINHKRNYVLDQEGMRKLWHEGMYAVCESLEECKAENRPYRALIRMHRVPWYPRPTLKNGYAQTEAMCALNPFFIRPDGKPRLEPPKVDPCHPSLLYIHILCQLDRFEHDARIESKIICLKLANMWFMESKSLRGRCPYRTRISQRGLNETKLRYCQPEYDDAQRCNATVAFQGFDY